MKAIEQNFPVAPTFKSAYQILGVTVHMKAAEQKLPVILIKVAKTFEFRI